MINSGIAPLDEQLGGMVRGRIHLLTGGSGTGKTTACLQFLNAGLQRGEPVGYITADQVPDLVAQARSIGFDLESPLRAGRLLLLRFRADFSHQLHWAGAPGQPIDELRVAIAALRPARLVVDPITPFLGEGSTTQPAVGISEFLEELGATTMLTYPGDVAGGYDARIGSVVQHAALVLHLTRGEADCRRLQVVQSRTRAAPASAVNFVFRPGVGLAAPEVIKKPAAKRTRAKAAPKPTLHVEAAS